MGQKSSVEGWLVRVGTVKNAFAKEVNLSNVWNMSKIYQNSKDISSIDNPTAKDTIKNH